MSPISILSLVVLFTPRCLPSSSLQGEDGRFAATSGANTDMLMRILDIQWMLVHQTLLFEQPATTELMLPRSGAGLSMASLKYSQDFKSSIDRSFPVTCVSGRV